MNEPEPRGEPAIALISTGIRPEERMLIGAFEDLGHTLHVCDDRLLRGDLARWPVGLPEADLVLLRSKSHWRNLTLARWLEALGAVVLNRADVIETCGDKIRTTLALLTADVPTVPSALSLTPEGGRLAGAAMGFPLVVKPVIGSWGRLIGKVNDPDALETILDHKAALGGVPHAVNYLQSFVEHDGVDLRSFVVDGVCVAAIERRSERWKTNTALGAEAVGRALDPDLVQVSEAAARAVGGGAVAVDLFETDEGYLVNEVNGTMEFRNSPAATGVDIPGSLAEYAGRVARAAWERGRGPTGPVTPFARDRMVEARDA